MNLNRNQLSFLITFLLMSIVVLLLFNVGMSSEQEEEYLMEITLEEELEELLQEAEFIEQQQAAAVVKTHMAYNETAKSRLDAPEPLKTLEELVEEGKTSEAANDNDTEEGKNELLSSENGYAKLQELIKKRKKIEQSYGEKTTNALKTVNTTNKNASVSYSLLDRIEQKLPIPIYTCLVSGKIVVNIRVNSYGDVTEATINGTSSSTTNGCLTENAMLYALQSRFDSSSKPEQIGTITYLFQGK